MEADLFVARDPGLPEAARTLRRVEAGHLLGVQRLVTGTSARGGGSDGSGSGAGFLAIKPEAAAAAAAALEAWRATRSPLKPGLGLLLPCPRLVVPLQRELS